MIQNIRDIINSDNGIFYNQYFSNHPDEWNILCVAMDTFGDSELVIEYFEKKGFGNDDGEKYIQLYGVMQAMYMQKVAIEEFYGAIHSIPHEDKYVSEWKIEILERFIRYRNLLLHPIKCNTYEKGEKNHAYLNRNQIEASSIEYRICDSEGKCKTETINIGQLIIDYETEISTLLLYLEKTLGIIKVNLQSQTVRLPLAK